jgi:acylphosphatase
MTCQRVIVHGRVQGVFFRDSCRAEAVARGVAGWVRNRPDRTVEALFEGEQDAVDQLVAWAHRGPAAAQVERVEVFEDEPQGRRDFEVRQTPADA